MTDFEKLKNTLEEIGIPFEIDDFELDTSVKLTSQLSTDDEGHPDLFFIVFDKEGNFLELF